MAGNIQISNKILREYLRKADGVQLKIYLCLQYLLQNGEGVSEEKVSEITGCASGDFGHALYCLQRDGLLTYSVGKDGSLNSLTIDNAQASIKAPTVNTKDETKNNNPPKVQDLIEKTHKAQRTAPVPVVYQQTKIREIVANNEGFRQIRFIAESYFKRPMAIGDIRSLVYVATQLKYSFDMTEYLLETCANEGKTSAQDVYRMAVEWYERGYDDVRDVRLAQCKGQYRKQYYQILGFLGVRGRAPIASEIEVMDCWIIYLGMDMEIIEYACELAVMSCYNHGARMDKASEFLTNWYENSVHTPEDAKRAYEKYMEERKQHYKAAANSQNQNAQKSYSAPAPRNRFNNFNGRSDVDWDALAEEIAMKDLQEYENTRRRSADEQTVM